MQFSPQWLLTHSFVKFIFKKKILFSIYYSLFQIFEIYLDVGQYTYVVKPLQKYMIMFHVPNITRVQHTHTHTANMT